MSGEQENHNGSSPERDSDLLDELGIFERLRMQNQLLKDELLDLQRRHVDLQREHIALLEKHKRPARRSMSNDERARIIDLARQGMHRREIAEEVDRPYGTINAVLNRARSAGILSPES